MQPKDLNNTFEGTMDQKIEVTGNVKLQKIAEEMARIDALIEVVKTNLKMGKDAVENLKVEIADLEAKIAEEEKKKRKARSFANMLYPHGWDLINILLISVVFPLILKLVAGPIAAASAIRTKAMPKTPSPAAPSRPSTKPKSMHFIKRVEEWFNILYCRQSKIIRCQKDLKEGQKEFNKKQAFADKKIEYLVKKIEQLFGEPYVEESLESDSEEEEETDGGDEIREAKEEEEEEEENDDYDDDEFNIL